MIDTLPGMTLDEADALARRINKDKGKRAAFAHLPLLGTSPPFPYPPPLDIFAPFVVTAFLPWPVVLRSVDEYERYLAATRKPE